MTNKQKKQDKLIWIRLGLELAALEYLFTRIFCDPDYLAVMGKTELRGLDKAAGWITDVRSSMDSRSYRYAFRGGPEWFFGISVDPARRLVDSLRQKVREEAYKTHEEGDKS